MNDGRKILAFLFGTLIFSHCHTPQVSVSCFFLFLDAMFPFCLRSTQTPPSFFAGEVPSQLQQLREKLLQAVPALPAELQKQLQVVVREGNTKRSKEEKCQERICPVLSECRNFMKLKSSEKPWCSSKSRTYKNYEATFEKTILAISFKSFQRKLHGSTGGQRWC